PIVPGALTASTAAAPASSAAQPIMPSLPGRAEPARVADSAAGMAGANPPETAGMAGESLSLDLPTRAFLRRAADQSRAGDSAREAMSRMAQSMPPGARSDVGSTYPPGFGTSPWRRGSEPRLDLPGREVVSPAAR